MNHRVYFSLNNTHTASLEVKITSIKGHNTKHAAQTVKTFECQIFSFTYK